VHLPLSRYKNIMAPSDDKLREIFLAMGTGLDELRRKMGEGKGDEEGIELR
jgi:hypothetical protein